MTELSFTTHQNLNEDLIDAIERPLLDSVPADIPPHEKHDYAISINDDSGAIIGGLTGYTVWNWMYIDSIGIDEAYRGQGHAYTLMAMAEKEALKRGCVGVWMHTITFQAPGFYEKAGYEAFGSMKDCPKGHDRIFFRKYLDHSHKEAMS